MGGQLIPLAENEALSSSEAVFELRKHPLLQRGPVRQLGIHGARGSGKTCYLAALYGKRINSDLDFSLSFNEDNPEQSFNHLHQAWRDLQSGNVPPATALVNPFRLSLTATYHKQSWRVRTLDYAGALVQRTPTGTPELKHEVQQWLCDSDAILIFVDLNEQSDQLLERVNELDMLIDRLRKLSPDGQVVPIPVAVLFTKWDRVAGNLQGAQFKEQQEKLRNYLARSQKFKQFYEQVSRSSDRVEVFPVSAFGACGERNVPPPDGARPFGIHEPLMWVLQQCDQAILDALERKVQPWLERRWPWYGKAISCYKTHARQRLLTRGPVAASLAQRIRQLRLRAFFRLVATTVMLGVALLAAAAAALWAWDSMQYRYILARFADKQLGPDEKVASARKYLETKNPFASWLRRRDHVAQMLSDFLTKWHGDDYLELFRFMRAHKDQEEQQAELRDRCQAFLQRWPDSPHRAEVETWLKDAEQRLQATKERKDWESLVAFCTNNPSDSLCEARIKMIEEFLKAYPDSPYRGQANDFLNEDKMIRETRWQQFLALRTKCEELEKTCSQLERQGGQFPEFISQLHEWDNECASFRHKCPEKVYERDYAKEIQNLVARGKKIQERAEKAWDCTEYEKFYQAAIAAANDRKILAFQNAEEQAYKYFQGPHPKKKHRASVQKWLDWLDGLRKHPVNFTIVEAKIGENATVIGDPGSAPDVVVGVELSTQAGTNQAWWTPKVQDSFRPPYDHLCPNAMISWNDPNARLTLTLIDMDFLANDVLRVSFTGPDVIFLLDQIIAIRDGDAVHHVLLKCPGLKPPHLPRYHDDP